MYRVTLVVGLRSSRLVLIVEAARWCAKSSVGVASVRSSVCAEDEKHPRRDAATDVLPCLNTVRTELNQHA